MKTRFFFLLAIIGFLSFTSCNSDDDKVEELDRPSLSNVEVGSGNNGQGTIGRDFHLNADIVAGERIDLVTVDILPLEGEDYTEDWSFNISWDEFKGLRNTTVHKHFDIPEDAPEGNFNFIITVTDENGTILEEVYDLQLIDASNLPVDPYLYTWDFFAKGGSYYFVNELLENPEDVTFAKQDTITSSVSINSVKGDGEMYMFLVKKSANHLPETIEGIDLSKVIVYDVKSHENEEDVFSFSNRDVDEDGYYTSEAPELIIGSELDNNNPEPNPIDGEKEWENVEYYLGVVYTNTTYDISVYHYVELEISGF
ncbi:DUF4625 domain-containing protein [Autumnicola musiva]|uniref:DUF4625 domain-containing protein n=1 Tax=Autumnicola musiva TaxID=3075589 RepID=A0ABU3DAH6_9FLAO|nr:DUF4625 domain-containing protein [Zunongwangia sp. F117]MDT0678536.1 DUF4625 domain-containing protein [Zunongwangia sp. F117]